jgi:hypothetical protein
VGSGVRSSPIAKGENSGEGERDAMPLIWQDILKDFLGRGFGAWSKRIRQKSLTAKPVNPFPTYFPFLHLCIWKGIRCSQFIKGCHYAAINRTSQIRVSDSQISWR